MPNHVSTRTTLNCDQETASSIFAEVAGDKKPFDFERLIPMPPHVFRGNLDGATEERLGEENCWYGWCRKHWGTKWNAYSHKVLDAKSMYFETAWSVAEPVFDALSARYPDLSFTVEYADEDIGRNAGIITYHDKSKAHVLLQEADAAKLYFAINSEDDPKDYGYDPETFEYVGEDAA